MSDRCPSCDHLRDYHSEPGCWFAVTQGTRGEPLNCRCTVVDWPVPPERDGGRVPDCNPAAVVRSREGSS